MPLKFFIIILVCFFPFKSYIELLHLILMETFEGADINDSRRQRKLFSWNSCSVISFKFEIQFAETWLLGTDRDPPQKQNSLLITARSHRTRRQCLLLVTVGRWWHFGGSLVTKLWNICFEKLLGFVGSPCVILVVKYPRKKCMHIVCSGQLCESEVQKKVTSFELEWENAIQRGIYSLNFDLPYLYYYCNHFSGG